MHQTPTNVTPKWVKATGLALVLAMLVMLVAVASGHHGLGRHFMAREAVATPMKPTLP